MLTLYTIIHTKDLNGKYHEDFLQKNIKNRNVKGNDVLALFCELFLFYYNVEYKHAAQRHLTNKAVIKKKVKGKKK